MAAYIDLKVGESMTIGPATVTLQKKSGQLARLVVDAPEDMKVEVNRYNMASQAAKGISARTTA